MYGPSAWTQYTVEEISAVKINIVQSPNEWIRTWDGGWSVLETNSTTVSAPSATGSGVSNAETRNAASLPTAAKVGVGVGVGMGILICIVLASFLLWWTKRAKTNQQIAQPIQSDMPTKLDVKYTGEQD